MLHLHDSKIFARVVQLSILTNTVWSNGFLDGIKVSGSPMQRLAIVRKCQSNVGILQAIISIGRSIINTVYTSNIPNSSSQLLVGANKIISFVTATLIELANERALNETQLRQLFPYLIEGLKVGLNETSGYKKNSLNSHLKEVSNQWRRSSCMIISQICTKTTLAKPILKSFLTAFIENYAYFADINSVYDNNLCVESVYATAVLAQYQSIWFSPSILNILFNNDVGDIKLKGTSFFKLLVSLKDKFDVTLLVSSLVSGLTSNLFVTQKFDKNKTIPMTPIDLGKILMELFTITQLCDAQIMFSCIVKVLNEKIEISRGTDNVDRSNELNSVCSDILRFFSQRYPQIFDKAITFLYNQKSSNKGISDSNEIIRDNINMEQEVLMKVLGDTFNNNSYHLITDDNNENSVSLLLSLNHTSDLIRIKALSIFVDSIPLGAPTTPNICGLVDTIISTILVDHNIEIMLASWNVDVILRVVEHTYNFSIFLNTLNAVINYWAESFSRIPKRASKALAKLLQVLEEPIIHKKICKEAFDIKDLNLENRMNGNILNRNISNGSDYLFHMVCGLLLGLSDEAPSQSNDLEKYNKYLHAVQVSSWNLAYNLKNEVYFFKGFEPLSKSKVDIKANFLKSIASHLFHLLTDKKSSKVFIEQFNCVTNVVISILSRMDLVRKYIYFIKGYVFVIHSFLHYLSQGKKIPDGNLSVIGLAIGTILPFCLSLFKASAGVVSESILCECLDYILSIDEIIFKCSDKFVMPTYSATSQSIQSYLSKLYTQFFDSNTVGVRILLSLLAKSINNDSIVALITRCFNIYFQSSSNALVILTAIALGNADDKVLCTWPEDPSFVMPISSNNDAQKKYFYVGDAAKCGAIHMMKCYISSSSFSFLFHDNDCFVLYSCFLILVYACSSEIELMKLNAINLAECLSNFKKEKECVMKISVHQSLNGNSSSTINFSLHSLRYFSSLIINNKISIGLDRNAINCVIKDIFNDAGGKKGDNTYDILLSTCISFGQRNPHYVYPILSLTYLLPLNVSWCYIKTIFDIYGQMEHTTLAIQNNVNATMMSLSDKTNTISLTGLDIIDWIESTLTNSSVSTLITEKLISVLGQSPLIDKLSQVATKKESKKKLFLSLLHRHSKHSGNKDIVAALSNISIDLDILYCIFKDYFEDFTRLFNEAEKNADKSDRSDSFDNNKDTEVITHGMAQPLHSLISFIEIIKLHILKLSSESKLTNPDVANISKILVLLFDILAYLNNKIFSSVLFIDYSKSLLMDLCSDCIQLGGDNFMSLLSKKTAKSGNNVYDVSRVGRDLEIVLSAISSKAASIYSSTLRLISFLVKLNPEVIKEAVNILSRALSDVVKTKSNVSSIGLSFNASSDDYDIFVTDVLKTFVTIATETKYNNASAVNGGLFNQSIIESLFLHFQDISSMKRSSLQSLALNVLGYQALPASVVVLLTHALQSYQNIGENGFHLNTESGSNDCREGSEYHFILLSKNAYRNSIKALKTSVSEELFRLSIDSSLKFSAKVQVSSMITLLKVAHKMLNLYMNAEHAEVDGNVIYPIQFKSVSTDVPSEQMTVNVFQLLQYSLNMRQNNKLNTIVGDYSCSDTYSKKSKKGDNKLNLSPSSNVSLMDDSPVLLLLFLEYVSDLLENKQFHRSLVLLIDNNKASISEVDAIQVNFLELSEQVLQILQLAKILPTTHSGKNHSITVDGSVLTLSSEKLGATICSWCLDILRSMQKLLDAPTFISILQELITHEEGIVRQRALLILRQRLEEIHSTGRPSGEERALLFDLMIQLTTSLKISKVLSISTTDDENDLQIGINQSSLMCMDVLARYLGKSSSWHDSLLNCLNDLNSYAINIVEKLDKVYKTFGKIDTSKRSKMNLSKNNSNLRSNSELLKLLGTIYLTIGTISYVLGVKVLPILPSIMANFINSAKNNIAIISEVMSVGNDIGATTRPRILLFRSIVVSITAIIATVPKFFHLYIKDTILLLLSIDSLEANNIGDDHGVNMESDVDRCLGAVSSIEPRLSLPMLLETTEIVFSNNNNSKYSTQSLLKYSSILGDIWKSLDRTTVVSQMSLLCPLATLSLDFRTAYDRNISNELSVNFDVIDEQLCNSVVELCLKFTEFELKGFLNQLYEWKDVEIESTATNQYAKYSRSVTYYNLLVTIGNKLRSVATQTLGLFWKRAADTLGDSYKSIVKLLQDSNNGDSKAHVKKRKASEVVTVTTIVDHEVFQVCCKLLQYFRVVCVHDQVSLINDANYDLVMPNIVQFLSFRDAFESDEKFIHFCESYVVSAMTALAVSINNDIAWKGMNHKILLLTRDKRKVVRIIAIKALHKLFIEVGDEYLLLLPECLPYLSELLEDDAIEIAQLTQEVIRYIEELSGEKLDSYLQ